MTWTSDSWAATVSFAQTLMQRNADCRPRMAFLLGISGTLVLWSRALERGLYSDLIAAAGPNGPRELLAGSAACLGENRVQEQGVRNGAYGADKFGFKNLAEVRWNLTEPTLYEYADRGGRSFARRRRRALRRNRPPHRPQPARTSTPSSMISRATSVWWDGNRKMSKENFDNLLADFMQHAEGKKLFAQDLSMAAPIRNTGSRRRIYYRTGLALAVHPPAADPSRARRACKASFPNSPFVDLPSFRPTPNAMAAARAPTRWSRSISPARSC